MISPITSANCNTVKTVLVKVAFHGHNSHNGCNSIMAVIAIMSVMPVMCVMTFAGVWTCLKGLDTLPGR